MRFPDSRPALLVGLIRLALGLAVPASSTACEPGDRGPTGAPENLHLYLLIGQSNMAGRAKIPEGAGGVIDRCYLLNDKNEWVPARNPLNLHSTIGKGAGMQKLGPGYSFVRKMLVENPEISIGLVVNARGGSKIEDWVGDEPRYYQAARERMKVALQSGTLKGVLWHQGESNSERPDGYLDKLISLVAKLRNDFGDTKLPFVAGEIHNTPAINDQIAELPEVVHATGVASSEGLTATDRWHFDTRSQLLLGERYAERMLKLQAERPAGTKPPEDLRPKSDRGKTGAHPPATKKPAEKAG